MSDTPEPTPETTVRRPSVLRRVAPWLVALATLAWLFAVVPLDQLRVALARAPLTLFMALLVGVVLTVLVADCFATWATFRSALPEAGLTFRETLDIRGASYLLAIIHYGAGQGGVAYFVNKKHGVPLARATGAVMLIMGVNVMAVALVALLGVLLGGAPTAPALRLTVIGLACAFPAYLAVIAARPAFLARRRLLAPLFHAGLRGHAVAMAARVPHILCLFGGHYAALRVFSIDASLSKTLALLPIYFVVAVLPISPSGIGTAQATLVGLFAAWAPGDSLEARKASVLACGLALQFGGMLLQALVGLVFLRRLTVSLKTAPP